MRIWHMIESGSAAGGGAKYSMEFDILEGVPEREYYGRDALSVIPVEDIREQADHLRNDYIYVISVKFGGKIEE